MEYDELIKGFAAKFAVDGLEATDGVSAVEIDGMTVAFVSDEKNRSLTVVADIGEAPPDSESRLPRMLLKANWLFRALDGAVLCQNPDKGNYAVERSLDLAGLDVETLSAAVEKLVDAAERWRGMVNGLQEAEERAQEMDENAKSLGPLSPSGGFMQV